MPAASARSASSASLEVGELGFAVVEVPHRIALDGAAPGAGGLAAGLDEVLEAIEVLLGAVGDETTPVGDVLEEPFRVHLHLEHDLGRGVGEGVERDDAGVLRPVVAVHATRWSADCSVISAFHVRLMPAIFAVHSVWVSSIWRTSTTCSMKSGKSSNWVHWS